MCGEAADAGLWSEHFRAHARRPAGARICGFVCTTATASRSRARGTRAIPDGGDPPIVFTLGSTAVHVAGRFYEAAAGHARSCAVAACS